MNYLITLVLALLAAMAHPAFAAEPQSAGQVKIDLLKQLERDGFLSNKLANEAKEKYVDPRELSVPLAVPGAAPAKESLWDRYVSWTNVLQVVGIAFLVVAFGGYIARVATWAMVLIIQVPKKLYQTVFLTATATATLRPDLIWASQAFYLALFGAFANIILLAWLIESHPKLQAALAKLFNLGLPPASVISFWGMLYFGALAVGYQSQIFGFFAAVCLSGVLTFAMVYRPGVLTLFFHQKGTPAVVLGHLAVLAVYAALKISGNLPEQVALFAVGLEYYCAIAMGVGFLVGASPFVREKGTGGYFSLFILVLFAAMAGYFFYDLKVIGSIVCTIGVLLALEWISYLSYKTGFLVGTTAVGASLYAGALLLERYAHFIVLRLA